MFNVWAILAAVAAYFLGNISPAILVSRAIGGKEGDIRKQGSGNPGTTNMLRVYGKKAAAVTLL
ncbi:MAG: glycerol-3-phosphate acyltransferase, partial [Firmicutes bacterium]|nr:glycerol-3-phosphate acyltransferase [Bacillota bacterium]